MELLWIQPESARRRYIQWCGCNDHSYSPEGIERCQWCRKSFRNPKSWNDEVIRFDPRLPLKKTIPVLQGSELADSGLQNLNDGRARREHLVKKNRKRLLAAERASRGMSQPAPSVPRLLKGKSHSIGENQFQGKTSSVGTPEIGSKTNVYKASIIVITVQQDTDGSWKAGFWCPTSGEHFSEYPCETLPAFRQDSVWRRDATKALRRIVSRSNSIGWRPYNTRPSSWNEEVIAVRMPKLTRPEPGASQKVKDSTSKRKSRGHMNPGKNRRCF